MLDGNDGCGDAAEEANFRGYSMFYGGNVGDDI